MTESSLSGPRLCEGRVCVITGAGRGIGREYALMLAAHGAHVVVNDLGGDRTGSGPDQSETGAGPAQQVVDEITAAGGAAVANTDNIATWDGAKALVNQAVEVFGGLDVVVTSVSGIYGNVGQANYGAAKAGIAGFTIIAARELGRYGVTVNAIAPGALTRMTEDLPIPDERKAELDPRWVAPVCVWLASKLSADVTEQIIEVAGTTFAIAEGWHRGPSGRPVGDPADVDTAIRKLLADARSHTNFAEVSSQQKK